MHIPPTEHAGARHALSLLLILTTSAAMSCQRLDPNLANGPVTSGDDTRGSGGAQGNGQDAGGATSDTGGEAIDCKARRAQAYAILDANCAACHQAPGNPTLYSGGFNFILDLGPLTSSTSPQSSSTMAIKYVIKGHPEQSYLYQRIAGNSMPPRTRTQRPSAADLQALNQWISSCVDDLDSPNGWGPSNGPEIDAGVDWGAGADDGSNMTAALAACGPTNLCPDGGCCVFSRCRPNGSTCGALPNPIPGESALPGLPGTCDWGSCQDAAGMSCGKVDERCCDLSTCTAPQSSCLITDTTKCAACGGTGQPCCRPNACLDGRACVNGGVGRVGTCEVCGDLGQPCCGTGVAALQTCSGALTCLSVAGKGNLCSVKPRDDSPGTGGTSGGDDNKGTGGSGGVTGGDDKSGTGSGTGAGG